MNVRLRAAVVITLLLGFPAIALLLQPAAVEAAGQLQTFMTGLNWPVALAFSPDGRILFAERYTGSIRIIEGSTLLPTPLYTLPGTATAGERGLLGLALDPGFPASPWVYAYQTYNDVADGTIYNRIVRIRASGNTGLSYSVILRMPPLSGATNHNGGVIAFGPDGKLYAVVGENANIALAQDLTSPMGKVLRLNPEGTVPADNPFYGSPTADNAIYTYGHRNMFGLTFHPATGRAMITENGPGCNDEINVLEAGRNFGWGPTQTCTSPPPPPDNTNRDGPSPVLPIDWYTPTTAPTNAAVYLGPNFTAWQGDLIFGEWNTGRLRRLDLGPPNYDSVLGRQTILTAPAGILDVESGPDGAIWFTTPSTIYRYVDLAESPVAAFTATPSRVNPGQPVSFDASASYDPDGWIVSHSWDFGDGVTTTGITASHAYAAPGLYTVALTVVDNESCTATATQSVTVNAPPSARFTATPETTYVGVAVTFNASGSTDPDSPIVSFAWDFGDSATATGVNVSHAYAAKGRFTVTLTVTDDLGATGWAGSSIDVGNRAPVISAMDPSGAALTLSSGQARGFSITAADPDGDVLWYEWRVNGAVVGGNASSYTFNESAVGTYSVSVTVSDGTLDDSASWAVAVTTGGGPPPGPRELPVAAWWVAGLIVIAILAAAVLIVAWRRRRRESGPPPPPSS